MRLCSKHIGVILNSETSQFMNRCFKAIFLSFNIFIAYPGHCNDSTYITIQWNGSSDKPHNSFVFYRRNVAYNLNNGVFNNPFNLYVELSDSSFAKLQRLLFNDKVPICNESDYPLRGAYYVSWCNGEKDVDTWLLCTENDYKHLYRTLYQFLKGTKYQEEFQWRWKSERAKLPT
ncbi:hypothetical protein SAMN02745131_03377 [Flavisolibacter ginsengisoli DSM 18119]|uniref:Uncharacterized protein n=2 Tax=Flavisolibacter TaxID=398041 RepID=A0A1M5DXN8_9BACT|nr:hypothetical protein SAMN02745131_03377 [Flavisolibacter ginsengisoli DSM 18119]